MDRRDFLSWVSVGWIASFLPVTIAACSSPKVIKDWQKVARKADLDANNQLIKQISPFGKVLLIQTSTTENLIAVDPTCTHAGCTVEWKSDLERFVCPCHQSEFAVDGQLIKTPARRPLKNYVAKIEGDDIFIKSIGTNEL
ncbi:MAG: ubiquinol-cytochrome c reductase iron-sulfur subunit [Mastigocoleus sp. MO_167.B18]|nr:ubiquinol-cytochrome c reductase iron-sulfur subunit [Mastigocoleus sp. MO_167.B18]